MPEVLPPRSKRVANWPDGWQAEAQWLADTFDAARSSIEKYDHDRLEDKACAAKLIALQRAAWTLAQQFHQLLGDDGERLLVSSFLARESRHGSARPKGKSEERLCTYRAEIVRVVEQLEALSGDFALGAIATYARRPPDIGNQSTLAMRFMISAAANAFVALWHREPGSSRSDLGVFGHFLEEVIARIPEPKPGIPHPSTINDILQDWGRRFPPVARRSGR